MHECIYIHKTKRKNTFRLRIHSNPNLASLTFDKMLFNLPAFKNRNTNKRASFYISPMTPQ
jgi:hypothetical protein